MPSQEEFEKDDTLVNLRKDYTHLKYEFSKLIYSDSDRTPPRVRGSITTAGTALETILKYMLIKEGKEALIEDSPGKFIGLNDLIKLAQFYIPKEQNIHVLSIMKWRNHVAHGNRIDKLNEHELTVVNSAFNSIIEWFFGTYLNYQIPELPDYPNTSNDSKGPRTDEYGPDPYEWEPIKSTRAWAKIENQKQMLRKRRKFKIQLLALFFVSIIALVGYLFLNKSKSRTLNKEQFYDLMVKYYTRINGANFDSKEFFAESVSQFITYQNITPKKINEIVAENIDYIDGKTILDRESIHIVRTEGNISFWEYNIQYMCYRKSLTKFQNCKVEIEIGLTRENKIVSYKELKVSDLRFSAKKFN